MGSRDFLLILASGALILIVFTISLNQRVFGVSPSSTGTSEALITSSVGCGLSDLSGLVKAEETLAYFNGSEIGVPLMAAIEDPMPVLGVATEERWVEIDLSEQMLYAWEGDNLFMQTPISSGLPWTQTPTGEFRIWIKLRATKMEGGEGNNYYYLPNVPYVMFFGNDKVPDWKGYGLHGTYWHNDFGTPKSHGCVNLPTDRARDLYYWTGPNLPGEVSSVKSSNGNIGTRIVIHQ